MPGTVADDDRLHADVDGHGSRVVLVHGFTQNRDCWGPLAADLATDHEVVRVDAPGHGLSAHGDAGLPVGAALIGARGGRATYLGYSMGGRFALHLPLTAPLLAAGLVLVSATGGIDDERERAERRERDEALADRLERIGIDAFLDEWLAQPLFAGLQDEMQFRAARRQNTVEGLTASLRHAGTGTQAPLWSRLGTLDMPVLVVAGARDVKFSAEAERLAASIGANATVAVIPGSGHTVHLEAPDAFIETLRPWLTRHGL